jgi:uncharacterized cupredoxin-like copper-binding protein
MRRFVIVLLACFAVAGTAVAGFSFAGVLGPQTAKDTAATEVWVWAQEYSFNLTSTNSQTGPTVTSVPAGPVIFHVKNVGTIEHDFQISGQKTPTLNPGDTADLTVTMQPGQANYTCTIGEHATFGMVGTLNVTGQIQTTTQVITTNGTTITTTQTQTQPTTVAKPTATVKVTEKEWKITLPTVTKKVKRNGKLVTVTSVKPVKAGLIRFVIKNTGKLGHNFVIGTGQTTIIKPGQTQAINVLLTKGSRKFECSITGHAKLGMRGTLPVT